MRRELRTLGLALAAAVIAACGSRGNPSIGNGQSTVGQNVDFGIAYIKRSIPAGTTSDDTTALAKLRAKDDVTRPRNFWSQADVYLRTSASPEGVETNITASVTSQVTGSPRALAWRIRRTESALLTCATW